MPIRIRAALVLAVALASVAVLPSAGQAAYRNSGLVKTYSNGPFRPKFDCGPWRWRVKPHVVKDDQIRACAYHSGTRAVTGIQLYSKNGVSTYERWFTYTRPYGKAGASFYREFKPANDLYFDVAAKRILTLYVTTTGVSPRTCVLARTAGDYGDPISNSPWQHGFDNNNRCP